MTFTVLTEEFRAAHAREGRPRLVPGPQAGEVVPPDPFLAWVREAQEARTPDQAGYEPLPGLLVIEWPAPRGILPCFAEVAVYQIGPDYAEQALPGVTSLTLHVSPDGLTAEAETFLGEDGEPVKAGARDAAKDEAGEYRTAVFRYVVAGMRVRDAKGM